MGLTHSTKRRGWLKRIEADGRQGGVGLAALGGFLDRGVNLSL
jgi:hypothetical protein